MEHDDAAWSWGEALLTLVTVVALAVLAVVLWPRWRASERVRPAASAVAHGVASHAPTARPAALVGPNAPLAAAHVLDAAAIDRIGPRHTVYLVGSEAEAARLWSAYDDAVGANAGVVTTMHVCVRAADGDERWLSAFARTDWALVSPRLAVVVDLRQAPALIFTLLAGQETEQDLAGWCPRDTD